MENVLQLTHRADRDMACKLRRDNFRKIRLNAQRYHGYLTEMISSVKTLDGSAAHLEYCFTGFQPYGKHFVCAVWPRQPSVVAYDIQLSPQLRERIGAYVTLVGLDPTLVRCELNRDDKTGDRQYHFYCTDPHLPYRPYLLDHFPVDAMFSRSEQNDKAVIAHHRPLVLSRWQRARKVVDSAAVDCSTTDKVVELEKLMSRVEWWISERKNP